MDLTEVDEEEDEDDDDGVGTEGKGKKKKKEKRGRRGRLLTGAKALLSARYGLKPLNGSWVWCEVRVRVHVVAIWTRWSDGWKDPPPFTSNNAYTHFSPPTVIGPLHRAVYIPVPRRPCLFLCIIITTSTAA